MNEQRVVIVGTGHRIPPAGPAANEFRAFLGEICNTHRVRAIAEEMSQGALANWNVTCSLCHGLATATGVPHRYCDLDEAQRRDAGVRHVNCIKADGFVNDWSPEKIEQECRASHSIRERHWMTELLDLNSWPVLFVCGGEHVLAFQQLLQENGLSAEIAAPDWAPNQ
jgi:hypothetical protein